MASILSRGPILHPSFLWKSVQWCLCNPAEEPTNLDKQTQGGRENAQTNSDVSGWQKKLCKSLNVKKKSEQNMSLHLYQRQSFFFFPVFNTCSVNLFGAEQQNCIL